MLPCSELPPVRIFPKHQHYCFVTLYKNKAILFIDERDMYSALYYNKVIPNTGYPKIIVNILKVR